MYDRLRLDALAHGSVHAFPGLPKFFRLVIRSVVGTADERSGGDIFEAFGISSLLVLFKHFGTDVFHDRQVLRTGA